MSKQALVLIDLQEDFLAAPRLEPHRDTVVAGAARLIKIFRDKGCPILHVWTRIEPDGSDAMPHWKEQGIFSCVKGSQGHLAPPILEPKGDEPVFNKVFFSAFSVPAFGMTLRRFGIKRLLLSGLFVQTCLRQTALDAYQNGFQVRLALEATGTHDPLHGALTRNYLSDRSIASITTSSLLTEWEAYPAPSQAHSKAGMDALVASVRSHQLNWASLSVPSRMSKLGELVPLLEESKEPLARLIVEQVKKPILLARAEVERTIALVRAVIYRAEHFLELKRESEGGLRYHPRGIVAMITPWNNPLAIPMGKLAPALVYGNGLVWKPSPCATEVARALMRLLTRAGIPEGLIGIVVGDEYQARRLLAANVDAIAFSGSSRTGWSIVAQAAARMIPVQAELGGNNGAIVTAQADLETAAKAVIEGAFGFAGQRCTANRRVIVLNEIYDRFVELLEKRTSQLKCGNPWDEESSVPPMISSKAVRAIADLVDRAQSAGCSVLQSTSPQQGLEIWGEDFYPPTLVFCDDPRAEIVQEESFGPILVVQKARNFAESLHLLNGVSYGLVASLFSHDAGEQDLFLKSAQAGIVKLNASTVNAGVDLPFTGWKHSGCGFSEHGEANEPFFTKRQAIYY